MFRVSRPEVSRSLNKYKAHHKEFVRGVLHKRTTKPEPSMMEGNKWSKCKEKSTAFKRKGTGGVLDIWLHHRGILRQCPQESPLANSQVLIDGQNSLIRWWNKDICVDSLPNHVVLGGVSFKDCSRDMEHEIVSKVCSARCLAGWQVLLEIMEDFDSRLNVHEWNRKAKEEINLQKDVEVFVQALEHVRDFDSKLGSQLKTLDEVEAYAGFKKIMKGLQALLKMELREVRRDKRRQGDAEDELVCSKHQEGSAQRNGYGLGPNRWSFVSPLGQVLIQRRRDHDRNLQAKLSVAKAKSLGGRSFKHPGSASMVSLREIE
ncbi:hypothetical protein F2Q69_00024678 [Brassica cretica]|uniref:Uncharacterized protein n=1 Tax=Brassica cretica TaxID=69181 RepID=A0A8S9QI61_BRACR|nr:hypothetical protein F2Q69_00024678 [Brassica cretica]